MSVRILICQKCKPYISLESPCADRFKCDHASCTVQVYDWVRQEDAEDVFRFRAVPTAGLAMAEGLLEDGGVRVGYKPGYVYYVSNYFTLAYGPVEELATVSGA